MIEIRQFVRYPFALPVKLETIKLAKKELFDLVTRDISASGTFIPALTSFPEGTRVKLDFTLPINNLTKFRDIEKLKSCTGRVVRSESQGIAIQFDKGYQIESLKAL